MSFLHYHADPSHWEHRKRRLTFILALQMPDLGIALAGIAQLG